jgi:NAD(P)-dependent dehydrogenase (short-subunit alcohol dehydrogenase family)
MSSDHRYLDLRDRAYAVTGGGAGIGRATAEQLAALGARVAVIDRDAEAAEAVAEAVGGIAVAADIADADSVSAAFDRIGGEFGTLDGVVNSAGILGENLPLDDTTLDGWNRVLAVNLTGGYLVAKAAVPLLRKAGGGSIVFIASGVALTPLIPGITAYAASKGGVIALSKTLAKQLGAERIRVNVVCPGTVDTEMAPLRDAGGALDPELLARYALGRGAAPSEIADAAVYLVGPRSSYVTGTVFAVDGGRSYH